MLQKRPRTRTNEWTIISFLSIVYSVVLAAMIASVVLR